MAAAGRRDLHPGAGPAVQERNRPNGPSHPSPLVGRRCGLSHPPASRGGDAPQQRRRILLVGPDAVPREVSPDEAAALLRPRRNSEEDKLRRVLSVVTDPRYSGRNQGVRHVNGIGWSLPSRYNADHVAILRANCAIAFHALDKPEPTNVIGFMPAYRAVVRTLPVLAEAVARQVGRPAPTFPTDTQDKEAARRYVETVLDWCDGKAAGTVDATAAIPGDPAAMMRAAILRERRVQRTVSGSGFVDSYNWEAGVVRLWRCWDELLPEVWRPASRTAPVTRRRPMRPMYCWRG